VNNPLGVRFQHVFHIDNVLIDAFSERARAIEINGRSKSITLAAAVLKGDDDDFDDKTSYLPSYSECQSVFSRVLSLTEYRYHRLLLV
jgi:hypothetical protein